MVHKLAVAFCYNKYFEIDWPFSTRTWTHHLLDLLLGATKLPVSKVPEGERKNVDLLVDLLVPLSMREWGRDKGAEEFKDEIRSRFGADAEEPNVRPSVFFVDC